jgi:EmrB/QacA subfamily drug resistance transporter
MTTLPVRRRRLVLAICCLSLFLVAVDNTIVNIALPAIQDQLHAPVSGLQWIVAAYTLVLASLLILAGSTADRIGRRRVFQTGLVVFTIGSMLCGLAPDLTWLIVFRIVQAIGGCMLNPVALSIVTNIFTEPRERARAIGIWAGVVGISLALGPVLGGLLVQTVGWRSIFWVNVPVGVVALTLTAVFVPESRAEHARRFDPVGQAIVLITLISLTYGIIEGPSRGWSSPAILTCFLVAAAGLVALIAVESRQREPLLDPRYFRSIPFSGATVMAVCAFAALAGFLFLNTLYLQDERKFSPLEAGLYTLPVAVMSVVFAPLSGRLVGWRGPRPSLVLAGLFLGGGATLLTRVSGSTPVWQLLTAYAVFGFGFAMVNSPITYTAISGMPLAESGVAAAVASTSRQLGQSLGVAVIGSAVASALIVTDLGAGDFVSASRVGWWIIAGCGYAVLVLGVVTTGARARRNGRARARSERQRAPQLPSGTWRA